MGKDHWVVGSIPLSFSFIWSDWSVTINENYINTCIKCIQLNNWVISNDTMILLKQY